MLICGSDSRFVLHMTLTSLTHSSRIYDLIVVVTHNGRTAHSRHYMACLSKKM
ncbi:hypothetical protein Ddye_016947, partial [Dipteronia dyeriana]